MHAESLIKPRRPDESASPVARSAVRVLVADAAPTRRRICLALNECAVICAEADSRTQAIRAACSERPHVALIGQSIPGGGIVAIREISRLAPATAVVLLSEREDTEGLLQAVRAGATGIVPTHFDAEQLRRVIGFVIGNEAAVPRWMVGGLIDELRRHEQESEEHITLREAEILRMLALGDSTADIARALAISPVTVRRHISKLVRKAGVRDRDELGQSARARRRWASCPSKGLSQ